MTAAIIGINDAGATDLQDKNGRTHRVGLLHFFVTVNESKPEIIPAYYDLIYQESVFKTLNRLTFITLDAAPAENPDIAVRKNTGLKDAPAAPENPTAGAK